MGKNADISEGRREKILLFLLQNSRASKPARGVVNQAASTFQVSRTTVSRIWKAAQESKERGEGLHSIGKRHFRIRKLTHEVNHEQIAAVNFQERGSIRALADSISITKSTVGRWAKQNLIRAHTNAIKPSLTAPNKLVRLRYSLDAIAYDHVSKKVHFKAMENIVHIDEKWFYLTKSTHRYYLTDSETEPYRTCKSKKFIPKVMFMCAVSRPVFSEEGNIIWDGKLGIWPFVEEVAAKRSSKNRSAGTLELKPLQSMTKEVIKACLINNVIPAIKEKWPTCLSKCIQIQQDNARPHITNGDAYFQMAANTDGFNIQLVQQPPNSPDLNVNDLGFFRAIQSLQQQQACQDASELVNAVKESFNSLQATTLNKVFLSLQACFIEIMNVKGCNNYKVPHIKKDALMMQNALPVNLEIPIELVKECIQFMNEAGDDMEGMITNIGLSLSLL